MVKRGRSAVARRARAIRVDQRGFYYGRFYALVVIVTLLILIGLYYRY